MSTRATRRPAPPAEGMPPLETLDTEALRRKLAGLADPLARAAETPGERAEIRESAGRFCSVLAHLFGEELDRMTLWSRIDSALETAGAKVSDDDLDRFATLCLEHVRADAGRAAACDALGQLLATFAARPPEWRHDWLHYVAAHRYAVVVRGRARWEEVKAGRAEL